MSGTWYIEEFLWRALGLAEAPHIDNCGSDCSVTAGRDDCCQFCAAADSIRGALRECGVNAVWQRPGRTVVLSDTEMDAWHAEHRRVDEIVRKAPTLDAAMKQLYPETGLSALSDDSVLKRITRRE